MQNHTATNRPHPRPTNTAGVTTLTVSMSYTPLNASLLTVSRRMVLLLGWKRLQKNTVKAKFARNAEKFKNNIEFRAIYCYIIMI